MEETRKGNLEQFGKFLMGFNEWLNSDKTEVPGNISSGEMAKLFLQYETIRQLDMNRTVMTMIIEKEQLQKFKVEPALWNTFGVIASKMGESRDSLLSSIIGHYVKEVMTDKGVKWCRK